MFATPIIPGRLYRVRCAGRVLEVIAPHGCDAICRALPIFFKLEEPQK
jgi:hypothetical protein